jgi:hypothetical protein
MDGLVLSKTHKRILSTLLFVLEQKIEAIEHMILQPKENASYFIEQDLSEDAKKHLLASCKSLRNQIFQMSATLDVRKRSISQAQYVSTMQSQMWEHITDAFSGKLKGYGEKLTSDAKLIDPYIQQLSDTITKLEI